MTDHSQKQITVRDAATVVLWREGPEGIEVLMGQRGASAAFMPSKFVFPGGAVDPADHEIALVKPLPPSSATGLSRESHLAPEVLAAAAIRELWEETGLALGEPADWPNPPEDRDQDWQGFADLGIRPSGEGLRFIFRAITPPGRPRRFDARFFLVDARHIAGDPDDFSAAADELSHLHWVTLTKARALDLPFVTEVVLAEVQEHLRGTPPPGVPFFDNSGTKPRFWRLN
ncbi:MAG: NUDIX hydrolase [Pseudorhodobacter sp.]